MQSRQQHLMKALPNARLLPLMKRRQQVIPEPQPISCGRCSQPIPVFNTNKIPLNTFRSSIRFRPG